MHTKYLTLRVYWNEGTREYRVALAGLTERN